MSHATSAASAASRPSAPDLRRAIGFDLSEPGCAAVDPHVTELINVRLAALGQPIFGREEDFPYLSMSQPLLADLRQMHRLLAQYLPPADQRIQNFLDRYLERNGVERFPRLPARTLVLDRHGMARALSLPPDRDVFESPIGKSYRLANGILHNPLNDRRTTQGVFHVTEGGLPIPADKLAVPAATFGLMLERALAAPSDLLRLPFTASSPRQAECWVSLLLRPTVCPELPGVQERKSYEVRFFVPGSLVCNLDFVESIFGNAGDPFLADHDAALDTSAWTGHTGCVILAPHLTKVTKQEVGLPRWEDATARQRRDGMCWKDPAELYNGGGAFKLTARDASGVVVTILADNYFGYCKKEVKTQISFASNLFGLTEEEHAGGALAFPSYDLGEDFQIDNYFYPDEGHTFAELVRVLGDRVAVQPEGYGLDRLNDAVVYLPEGVRITLQDQRIAWTTAAGEQTLKLLASKTYVFPSGYRVSMLRPAEGRRWRLVGTVGEGVACHKPCTVSGGGKSEISKSIADAIQHGPVFVADLAADFDEVERILARDFSAIFRDPAKNAGPARPILGPQRSLGSVIKLLTPSDEYTEAHNAWLHGLPVHIKELVQIVKRFWKEDWGTDWRWRFSVDTLNGRPGNELKYRNQKLIASYLRVGYEKDGGWRLFGLRKDFFPAAKIQLEDDITASVVLPVSRVPGLDAETAAAGGSVKFVQNCEYRLFQRPDDAIVRGYDRQTEKDMSRPGVFFSNYQPLTKAEVRAMVEDTLRFSQFTEPMQRFLKDFAERADGPEFAVCNANPRLVDGKPTKNPRYLQNRPDLETPLATYLAEVSTRLARRLAPAAHVYHPVKAVMPGRRNNPPEAGIQALCPYGPIHYMELPELFMEVISSMTGRSPSTTGAGSEGALTKGPFNALLPIHDLNAAFVSFAVTGAPAFVSAAGYVGPKYKVDHDVSLLMPELFCRMKAKERTPAFLIAEGCLERVPDFVHAGGTVPASRLGWRITKRFCQFFFGRVFSNPDLVFPDDMLQPELQDPAVYAEGVANIAATHQRVAQLYFDDGSVELAVPPLRALLHVMAHGHHEGRDLNDPALRALFTTEAVLASDWYAERLEARQKVAVRLWAHHVHSLETFLAKRANHELAVPLHLHEKLAVAQARLEEVQTDAWRAGLRGTIGADPALV